MGTSSGHGQLGIIPMGCGNLLAKELGVPSDPAKAAQALLTARPQRVRMGIIEYQSAVNCPAHRYWIVAAGIGVDAQVICKVNPQDKARHGMRAYYMESIRYLLSRQGFRPFLVKWKQTESGQSREEMVTQVVVERVTYFGRCLKTLVLGQELGREDMQVILFKSSSRLKYLRYGTQLIGTRLGMPPKEIQGIEFIRAPELVCQEVSTAGVNGEVLAETDGELLGRLPVRVSVASDTVAVLCPDH